MKNLALKAENLSKQYRLGEVGTGTLSHDLNRLWFKLRGKEDPYLKIGEINDRSKRGGSDYVWSLRDINFEIEQGDAVGIIGKNGAGKSTLLKLLSKVTKPTTGSIKVNGRIASLLEVGTGFNPEMTGRENIYLNGAILGMRKTEITGKLDEIIEFSGVDRYIDTPVKRYSSGMYVRLAFAVAAHLESEILIVDEVLSVGDAEFQKKCLGKMGEVSEGEGRTVLFVSHNMGSVRKLCNKGILLNNGAIQLNGLIDNVINKYLLNNKTINNKFLIENKTDIKTFIKEGTVEIIKQESVIICQIDCVVISKENTKDLCLDLRIKDQKNQEFGFGSLGGLNADEKPLLKKGINKLAFFFVVDNLANGNYSISLDLAQPNVQYIHRLEDCLQFELIRSNYLQYRVMDQNWGFGSFEIKLNQGLSNNFNI